MKLTKEDWIKIASPVVMIVVGILLACSMIDSVAGALGVIVGVIMILVGAFYLSLGFIRRVNIFDSYALYGIGLIGLGAALIIQKSIINDIMSYIGLGLGWAMFLWGCLGFLLAIIYLMPGINGGKSRTFYCIELIIAVICGVIGGLIIFPIGNGIIPNNYLWLVLGIVITLLGVLWLVYAIMSYKQERRVKRSSSSSTSSSSSKSTTKTKTVKSRNTTSK